MAAITQPARFTEKEYLALEEVAELKHEYFGGDIVAMAGAELAHNQIAHNLHLELGIALRGRPCDVIGADQRVRVEATREYFYPDVVVVCGEPVLVEPRPRSLVNPGVIIEILSPSTETHDRNTKWSAYRTIPSLTDYLMIDSARRRVEHYARDPGAPWRAQVFLEGGRAELTIDVTLDLDAIYRRVALT